MQRYTHKVGYTRNEFQGRTVTHLEYESYIPLALKTMNAILLEARNLPPLAPSTSTCCRSHATAPVAGEHAHTHTHQANQGHTIELTKLTVHHLLGESPPLTPSLVISVSSPHRAEAFFVCEWLLERVKERVQVWKREWYADGTSFVGQDGEGVEGKGSHVRDNQWKVNFPC